MQHVAAQQLLCSQSHAADAPVSFDQMPPKGNVFGVQPPPDFFVMEHRARVDASLRALQNKVLQLKQQRQVRPPHEQHSMESQQQQHSAASGSSTGTETTSAVGAMLRDASAASWKDQQHCQGLAGKQCQQGIAPRGGSTSQGLANRPQNASAVMKRSTALDLSVPPCSRQAQTTDNAAGKQPSADILVSQQQAVLQHHQPWGQQAQRTAGVQHTATGRHQGCQQHGGSTHGAATLQAQRQQTYLPHHQSPESLQQQQQQQLFQQEWQLQKPHWRHQLPLSPPRPQQLVAHHWSHQPHTLQPIDNIPSPQRQDPTAAMWQGIDLVRKPLLQVSSRLGSSSCSSERLLTMLRDPRCLDLSDAALGVNSMGPAADHVGTMESEARLQRAWKQLQITGGAVAPAQQVQQYHKQHLLQQNMHRQQRVPAAFQVRQLASQHSHVRSQRLQQQHFKQQREQLKQQALSLLQQAFPASAFVGPNGRVQRAAAAAAARTWQPAAEAAAEEAAERAHAARVAALESSRMAATAAAGFEPQRGGSSSRAGKPPAARPAKKQLRLAEDDPQWKQSRFMSVLDHPVECPAGQHIKYFRPEHNTAKYAVLTMLHGAGWPNHMFWQRWVEAHPPGQVALCVHMKAGVAVGPGMVGHAFINTQRLRTSVNANWGDISLVEATIDSIAEILSRCPHVTHIALASGHDVPVSLMTPAVLLPGVSSFGMYQFGEQEHTVLQEACTEELQEDTDLTRDEAQRWSQALTFHHQWMVLSREHAAAVVKLRTEITVIGRVMHKACNSVKADMAPDEFIIVTALRTHGYVRSIQRIEMREGLHFAPGTLLNCYPTMVIFPAESSPHPVCWTDPDETVKCQLEDESTMQRQDSTLTLRRCLAICQDKAALFFRKIEIRQTKHEQQIELLSLLEQMWAGKSLKKAAGSRANSSAASGSRGSKRKRVPENGRSQQARVGSQGLAAVRPGDDSVGPTPSASAAGTEGSDDKADLHDVQSPAKRPATAQPLAAGLHDPAAAAAAAWPPGAAWPGLNQQDFGPAATTATAWPMAAVQAGAAAAAAAAGLTALPMITALSCDPLAGAPAAQLDPAAAAAAQPVPGTAVQPSAAVAAATAAVTAAITGTDGKTAVGAESSAARSAAADAATHVPAAWPPSGHLNALNLLHFPSPPGMQTLMHPLAKPMLIV